VRSLIWGLGVKDLAETIRIRLRRRALLRKARHCLVERDELRRDVAQLQARYEALSSAYGPQIENLEKRADELEKAMDELRVEPDGEETVLEGDGPAALQAAAGYHHNALRVQVHIRQTQLQNIRDQIAVALRRCSELELLAERYRQLSRSIEG
jgi:chromosome segregation ATPase